MKTMKKALALIIVLTLMLSLSATSFAAKDDPIKIGISIWSSTDTLGSEVKRMIDAAAETLGVETTWVDQAHISEQVTASAETLALADCDGVIDPEANPDEYKMACESPYYVGAVHESEVDNGKTLVTILGQQGHRKIGLEGWEPGDATFLGRWEGYKAGVEGKTAEAIIQANPDIDSLIVAGGGGDVLVGANAAIEALGLVGKVQTVSTDFLPDLDVKLENGTMAAESGGHYADPFFAFLLVYNAIKGNYEVPTDGFYEMLFPYMFVDSPESYANYAQYFTGTELPYYSDEIAELADMDFDALNEACAKLSVEDVVARHAK